METEKPRAVEPFRSRGRRISIGRPSEAVFIPLTNIPLTSFRRLEMKSGEGWSEE